MKYIKLYEYSKKKYYPGDYIIFDKKITDINPYKNYGIIKTRTTGQIQYRETYMYDVDYLDADTLVIRNILDYYITQDEIVGLMTKSQIEEFNLKADTKKFNL